MIFIYIISFYNLLGNGINYYPKHDQFKKKRKSVTYLSVMHKCISTGMAFLNLVSLLLILGPMVDRRRSNACTLMQ